MSRNKTYYPQYPSDTDTGVRPPTVTVGQLAEQLAALDQQLPVIFKSPRYGCFGPENHYALDGAARLTLDRTERHTPPERYFDEEEGVWEDREGYTEILPAWDGVIIS